MVFPDPVASASSTRAGSWFCRHRMIFSKGKGFLQKELFEEEAVAHRNKNDQGELIKTGFHADYFSINEVLGFSLNGSQCFFKNFLLVVEGDESDFRSLPFVVIIELGKSHIEFSSQPVFDS